MASFFKMALSISLLRYGRWVNIIFTLPCGFLQINEKMNNDKLIIDQNLQKNSQRIAVHRAIQAVTSINAELK